MSSKLPQSPSLQILYLSNGAKYALPEVRLEPAGTAIVDINVGLQSLGIAPYATLSGYVEIQYSWPWIPVCAMIRNVDTLHSIIFVHSVEPLSTANPPSPALPTSTQPAAQVVEGMWWKQDKNVTGFVSLSNTSARPIAAALQLSDQNGLALTNHNVTISSHGTKIVNLQELESLPLEAGGIRIAYQGPQGALLSSGGLEDSSVGYSAGLHFVPKEAASKPVSIRVAELGLMAGAADPMMLFPAGTKFTPYSILRNTSSTVAVIKPTLWWMEGGGARYFQFPALNLQAYHTQNFAVMAMLSTAGLRNFNGSVNLVFDAEGTHDGLLLAAGSVDQSNNYVFEVIPRGIGESASKSLPYWSTGNGDDTMVTLWNPADEAQDLIFELFFSGGHYAFPVHLDARATRTFNVSEIAENQIPDAEGNVVPAGIHDGSAKIRGSRADNEMILVAFDLGIYNVRKATCTGPPCQTCNGAATTQATIAANPFSVAVGAQTQLKSTVQWNTGTQYDLTSASTWTSSKTSVATVQTGLVKGVGAGSVTASASATSNVYAQQVCSYNPNPCPTTPISGSGGGTVGKTVTLVGSACTASGPELSASWGQSLTQCVLNDYSTALPSGGSCYQNGGTNCYQVTTNDCQTIYCPGSTRIANSACTQFLDTFPIVVTKLPAGCTP
jgi:hypothetical protein